MKKSKYDYRRLWALIAYIIALELISRFIGFQHAVIIVLAILLLDFVYG